MATLLQKLCSTPALAAVALLTACSGSELTVEGAASAEALGVVEDGIVGVSVPTKDGWRLEKEDYTLDGTYGFTLWGPEQELAAELHRREPVLRASLVYDLKPDGLEARIAERVAEYGELPLTRTEVTVGGHAAVAVGPIPGSTPSIEIYVPVDGRVYQLNAYGTELDAADVELLSNVKFKEPSRSVHALKLGDGKDPATFIKEFDAAIFDEELKARAEANALPAPRASVPYYNEYAIAEGCWTATSTFFVQTQHGMYANSRWGAGYRGWTIIGRPNFWNQYTHGSLGYGRCASGYYTNDKFAIDYPLAVGDVVFSPFRGGTVTFAGRNYTHADYGIFVSIRAGNGKYVNLSGHLSGLARGIYRGAHVTDESIIGYAGATGGGNIAVGEPHLHSAYYRYPSFTRDGSPYGGRGLQVVYHHYVGTAAGTGKGVYKYGWNSNGGTRSKGDWISN